MLIMLQALLNQLARPEVVESVESNEPENGTNRNQYAGPGYRML